MFRRQREYESEGLKPLTISYSDNHSVIDLLLTKPLGLLALLDEESNFPRATDHSLVGTSRRMPVSAA